MNKYLLALFFTGIAFTLLLAVSGCAALRPVRKPCITYIPVKRKIVTLRKPSPVPWEENGVEHLAMDIVVDPESMLGFFQYVGELEELAEKAGKCVEP